MLPVFAVALGAQDDLVGLVVASRGLGGMMLAPCAGAMAAFLVVKDKLP